MVWQRSLMILCSLSLWTRVTQSPAQSLSERSIESTVHIGQASPAHRHRKATWLQDLNLSEDQVQQLKAIRQRFRPQIEQQLDRLRQAHGNLQTLMSSDAPSDRVRSQYRQVAQIRQQLRQLHFESILAIREVFTPEQRRQVDAYMRSRNRENANQWPKSRRERPGF